MTLLSMVDRQVQHLIRLIDDLLEVSRVSRGKIELKKQHVELADILRHAIDTARPRMDSGGHDLQVALPADPCGITMIRKAARQSFGDTEAPLSHRQQHNATVRGQATAVEICCDFLARDGWKRERQEIIVCHGGRGWRVVCGGLA